MLKPYWHNQSVYIIGGGHSLKDFDWRLLHNKLTIGCNSAYLLGQDVCKVLIYGDDNWWLEFGEDVTKKYKGVIFSVAPMRRMKKPSNVIALPRKSCGLYYKCLGWNGNTGAAAVNLALLLGAKTVYLLGFDMKLGAGKKPNWHDQKLLNTPNPRIYKKFLSGFKRIKQDLPKMFPKASIVNVSKVSELKAFPKNNIDPNEFLKVNKCEQTKQT